MIPVISKNGNVEKSNEHFKWICNVNMYTCKYVYPVYIDRNNRETRYILEIHENVSVYIFTNNDI